MAPTYRHISFCHILCSDYNLLFEKALNSPSILCYIHYAYQMPSIRINSFLFFRSSHSFVHIRIFAIWLICSYNVCTSCIGPGPRIRMLHIRIAFVEFTMWNNFYVIMRAYGFKWWWRLMVFILELVMLRWMSFVCWTIMITDNHAKLKSISLSTSCPDSIDFRLELKFKKKWSQNSIKCDEKKTWKICLRC